MLHFFRNLLIFGEGGDGGAGAAPGDAPEGQTADTGVQVPDAGEQKPKRRTRAERLAEVNEKLKAEQQVPQAQTPPPEESFEDLIKGKYKEEYGKAVQTAIQGRFKGVRETENRLKEAEEMLASLVSNKYGLSVGEDGRLDFNAVREAMQQDDDLYEEKAAELGTSVETARRYAEMEQQLQAMQAEQKSREEYAAYQQVVAQAEAAKKLFPNLDLNAEMSNPDFARLIRSNVPVETAYRVIHDAEITAGAMQYAATKAKQQASAAIQAGQNRPAENGLGRSAPANIQPRVMDKAWREQIKRDARRGIRREF